jgi:DNA-binding NtrC family response regulator
MTLEHTRDNKTRAAEILGISLKTLHNKLNRLRGRVSGGKRQEAETLSR